MTLIVKEFSVSGVAAPRRATGYSAGAKRAFDLIITLLALPLWLPVIAVGAIFVMTDGGSPVYRQERIGRNGRIFRIWKLRTMVVGADRKLEAYLAAHPEARAEWQATQKLKQDPRVTFFGRVLRKSSLDELPQLFNVLAGEMSLVGPRPMMVSQRELYKGQSYYALRPGLTGLWQVSRRNSSRFSDRARFDNLYAASQTLSGDLGILVRTVGVVFRGTGY